MNAGESSSWLQLRNLEFSHGGRMILRNISIDIEPGELILLTGHNGSGKTTLLRIISGLLPPDRAELVYANRHHSYGIGSRNFLRANTCYLHQHPYLFDATVFKNIAYGLKRRGKSRTEINARVHEALQAAGLEHLAERHSHALSGGEKQRVAMLRAWVLSPKLMLLDEPVTNMDKPARQRGFSLINQMRDDGIAVIVTSHDPQHGELNISNHLHLYQGRMVRKKTPFTHRQAV